MTMFKIALAGTALVGSLATAMANNTCSFSGFYAGGQVGVGTTRNQINATTAYTYQDLGAGTRTGGIGNTTEARLAGTGVIGGLHIGYGKHFPNRFYLGFEAFANLSKNRAQFKDTDYTKDTALAVLADNAGQGVANPNYLSNVDNSVITLKAERKNSFGLALRPGMVFGNTLVNLILGVESAKFNYAANRQDTGVQVYAMNGAIVSDPYSVFSVDGKKSKRVYGFVPGLEVSFLANDHVMLGLRATHTMYRKAKIKIDGVRKTLNKNARAQATDIMAKISYKF